MHQQLSLFDTLPEQSLPPPLATIPIIESQTDGKIDAHTTLHAAIAVYRNILLTRGLADESIKAMNRDLEVTGRILGLNRPVGTLSPEDIEQLVLALHTTSSPATVARRAATVNGLLLWLLERGCLIQRLYIAIKRPEADLPTFLSKPQVKRLLDYTADMTNPRPPFLVRLLLTTGLKRAETTRLKIQDLVLDADPPYVDVRAARQAKHKKRRIRVPPQLQSFYQAYKEQYAPVERVFPISARSLDSVLSSLAEALKMPITFTALRWTMTVRDLEKGMAPEQLRRKLGLSEMTWKETLERIKRVMV